MRSCVSLERATVADAIYLVLVDNEALGVLIRADAPNAQLCLSSYVSLVGIRLLEVIMELMGEAITTNAERVCKWEDHIDYVVRSSPHPPASEGKP
jgi:hypothetical protein